MASGDSDIARTQCRPKNPYQLLRKLVELMEHPISHHATQRHLELLQQFLNTSHYAFWLQDIPYIIRLYECIVKRLDTNALYKKPLECLLYYSSIPPMLTKLSDQVEYARDYKEYFTILGYLILCLPDDSLKLLTLRAIRNLLIPEPPIGWCCVGVDYTREALEKSNLPETISELVQVISDDLYPPFLDVMFLICDISRFACQKMLGQNPVEILLQRFEPTWRERDSETEPNDPSHTDTIVHLDDTCCVLWKLLRAINPDALPPKPSRSALWSLRYALKWTNIAPNQKINRNNLGVLLLQLVVIFPGREFLDAGLVEDVAILALRSAGCNCCFVLEFPEDQWDFQFKKIVWALLHIFQRYQLEEFPKENEIMRAFTEYLLQQHCSSKGHVAQYCELSKILLKLIPKFLVDPAVFLDMGAPLKIMKLIEGYIGKPYDIHLLEACMYCTNEMLQRGPTDIIKNLCENNSVSIVTCVCQKILDTTTLGYIFQKILAYGFCILQILCATESFSNVDLITLCVDYLNRIVHPKDDDPWIDLRVTVCGLHLLWECTAADKSLHREFLKRGGIYMMLDITENCSFALKTLSLGILADSSKHSSSIPYLITWRKRGKKLLPMLMEIFKSKTEKRCDSSENAELNEDKPDNFYLALCREPHVTFHSSCTTKSELLHTCRLKIHSILYALKVAYKENVQVANEHYKLYDEKLNADDALTMLFAENFVSLKMCETWMNVSKELATVNVVPVDEDNELLIDKVEQIRQWRAYLQYTIEHIIKNEKQTEQLDELSLYKTLKEARLSDALDALKDLRYISNCTERMFQMKRKMMQSQQIDLERVHNANFHRTVCDLPFTNIYNQRVSIQSNVIYNRKEETLPISPVSLDSDQSLESRASRDELSEHQLEC